MEGGDVQEDQRPWVWREPPHGLLPRTPCDLGAQRAPPRRCRGEPFPVHLTPVLPSWILQDSPPGFCRADTGSEGPRPSAEHPGTERQMHFLHSLPSGAPCWCQWAQRVGGWGWVTPPTSLDRFLDSSQGRNHYRRRGGTRCFISKIRQVVRPPHSLIRTGQVRQRHAVAIAGGNPFT